MQSNTRKIVAYGGARHGGRSAINLMTAIASLRLGGVVVIHGEANKDRRIAELAKFGVSVDATESKPDLWILKAKP